MSSVSRETPPAPLVASGVFGSQLELVDRYVGWLADQGTVRGLIGPREAPRLWERHILNCGVLTDVIDDGLNVVDLGSGAGLPGLVVALRRPSLHVTLVEPLQRRVDFLEEVKADLALANVEIVRGRAEALVGVRYFDVVTSRALAPLGRLLEWSWPLVRPGQGSVLAMKGKTARDEIEEARSTLIRLRCGPPQVLTIEVAEDFSPTTVVRVESMLPSV